MNSWLFASHKNKSFNCSRIRIHKLRHRIDEPRSRNTSPLTFVHLNRILHIWTIPHQWLYLSFLILYVHRAGTMVIYTKFYYNFHMYTKVYSDLEDSGSFSEILLKTQVQRDKNDSLNKYINEYKSYNLYMSHSWFSHMQITLNDKYFWTKKFGQIIWNKSWVF